MNSIFRFVGAFIWALFSTTYATYHRTLKAEKADDMAILWGIASGKAFVAVTSWAATIAIIIFLIVTWSI